MPFLSNISSEIEMNEVTRTGYDRIALRRSRNRIFVYLFPVLLTGTGIFTGQSGSGVTGTGFFSWGYTLSVFKDFEIVS